MTIYLDNNATTQPSETVIDAMLPYLRSCYFNASSAPFTGADKPRVNAATALAELLNAEDPQCFAFTSGATESNNWVLNSATRGLSQGRIIITRIEHPSVAEPAHELTQRGFDLFELPVDTHGLIELDSLASALQDDAILVSVIAANNETGVIQPIAEIGRIIHDRCPAAIFHTDATQAVGKIAIDLQDDWQDVDLLSFSGHKFHAPKGVGGIYVRPGIKLVPMILGGGQQQGLRAGTLNTAGLAGLAQAANEVNADTFGHIESLRNEFEQELQKSVPAVLVHGNNAPRLPNTSFFSLPGVLASHAVDILAAECIYCATGSACSAGSIQPSKTLLAMGIPYDVANCAVRVSTSKSTTRNELRELIRKLRQILNEEFSSADTTAFGERHRV